MEAKKSDLSKNIAEETGYIFRVIDLLSQASQHNTLLVWQGVNRSIILFGSSIAICTLLLNLKVDHIIKPIGCLFIFGLSIIYHRFVVSSITRNNEHVYKYNKSVGKLEKILQTTFCQSQWIRYLPITVYETALKGTNAAELTKQVARAFPWSFLIISYFGLIASFTWFLFSFKIPEIQAYLIGIFASIVILFFIEFVLRRVLQTGLVLYYKDETIKWNEELNDLEND